MKKLKIFYHVVDLNLDYATFIFKEQLAKMESSGLLDAAELNVNCHYNERSFDELKNQYTHPNIKWIFDPTSIPEHREITTTRLMKDAADNLEEEFYMLYLHQKGITYDQSHPVHVYCTHWRWLLDYWSIEQWQRCVDKLDEGHHDAVGCEFRNNPLNHLSGNVYWVRSSFIKKCNKLPLCDANRIPYEIWPEMWVGANGAKFYSFHDTTVNHYHEEYPPDRYRIK